MSLIQRIEQALLASMRERQQETTAVLRMLKNSIKNFTIAKRMPENELTDEQVVGIVRQEAKKRKESIAAFTSGNRIDLADKEQRELVLLEAYLPAGLSSDQIQKIITDVIAEQQLTPPYQFGSVMGAVVKLVAGRADGQAVKAEVEKYIAAKN